MKIHQKLGIPEGDLSNWLASHCSFEFQGRNPYETVMNYTPDIYKYAAFSWLQCSWLFDENLKRKQVCRWLWLDHGVGQAFCSYILTDAGGFNTISSVIPIYKHKLTTNHMTKQFRNFMERAEAKIGNSKASSVWWYRSIQSILQFFWRHHQLWWQRVTLWIIYPIAERFWG